MSAFEEEESISLRQVVTVSKEYFHFILSKWKFVLTGCLITALLGMLVSLIIKPKYLATTTVALETSNSMGGMLSGAMQLANSFGLGGSFEEGEDKLMDILLSKNIVSAALLSEATISNKNDYLINHFMEIYGYREQFDEDERMKGFSFTSPDLSKLSYVHDSILNIIYKHVIDKEILTASKNNKSLIITIEVKTTDEDFSRFFSEKLIEAVSKYYVENITKKERETVEVIQQRVDSTLLLLNVVEDKYARWKDASMRLIKMQGSIEEIRLRRDIEILSTVYGEGIKNLEMAKFALLNETPILQVIDKPSLSLEKSEMKLIVAMVVGFILGGFFSVGFLVVKKFYNQYIAPLND